MARNMLRIRNILRVIVANFEIQRFNGELKWSDCPNRRLGNT